VLYLWLLVKDGVSIDNESLFVTDIINLKIKSVQSFGGANKNRVCVYVFIGMSIHMCINIYVCNVFLKIYYNGK
jgi:hypothetical protein